DHRSKTQTTKIFSQNQTYPRLYQPLTDSILHHILSFLPTEDAIKTSVLSKSWYRLWTFASDLSFYNRGGIKRVRDFVAFVRETLNLYSCVKLDKFLIDFEYSSRYSYYVNKWVRFTTTHKVENLYLEFYGTEKANTSRPSYLLPRLLCTNSTLKLLSLRFCKFATKPTICWTSLTVLRISCASLTHDMIQNILLGSPALTELRLYNFVLQEGGHKFYEPEKLELDGEEDRAKNYGYATVEISAPNLLFLSISGFMYKRKFQLTNVLSLVEAKLSFECKSNDYGRNPSYLIYRNDLRELLLKLLHIPKLTISTWCLQLDKWNLPGIANLLQSLPYLEKLVINLVPSYNSEVRFYFLEYWKSQNREFGCLSQHLNTVEIVGFEAKCFGLKYLTGLVQFLLKHARVLEKLVIYGKAEASNQTPTLLEACRLCEVTSLCILISFAILVYKYTMPAWMMMIKIWWL
ncbi:hypothetical protein ACB092_05G266900, partial [Castanea dentata]